MKNSRWIMLGLCFLATAINYIDRANLGVSAPFIQKEMNIDPSLMGAILGAFFWSYAAMQLPSGWLVDRFGEKKIYAVVVAWWSLCTMAMAGIKGVPGLFITRFLLGVGEAGGYPSNTKVTARWFPVHERGLASGIFDSGSRVGTALSLPIITMIVAAAGWRTSFIVTGALGFIWIIVWLVVYRHPDKQEAAYVEQQYAGARATATSDHKVRWVDLFRYRTMWGMMLGFFCMNFSNFFFVTWFPSYLIEARGFSLPHLGVFGTFPALCAIPGGWLGGYVSDRLIRKGWSVTAARKTCLVGGMIVSSVIALAAYVDSNAIAIALFCLAFASIAFTGANVWSLPSDIAPNKDCVASIAGIQNFAANLAGICIAMFTGIMVSITHGSFTIPLFTGGVICLIGAFSYLFIVGKIEPLPAKFIASSAV